MQRKNKFGVLWKTTLLSKKDQSPKKSPEYKVSICICCSWIYSKVFPYKLLKKEFSKNPFLIKTFCYRNCTLYEAEILWSLSFSFRNLIRIQHRILNQLYCFVHFWNLFFSFDRSWVRSGTRKYLGKKRLFWYLNPRNNIQTRPVPELFGTRTHHHSDQCRCLHLIGLQIDKKCFSTVFFP